MLEGQGRIVVQGDPNRPRRGFLYFPIDTERDSQFPYRGNCRVHVAINSEDGEIVITSEDR